MSSFHGLSRQVAVFQISQQTEGEVIATLQLNLVSCCTLLPVPAGMGELTVPGATVSPTYIPPCAAPNILCRDYPESLIAWIFLLTWANPKSSRIQGLQPCTHQEAVTSNANKGLPISNHTSNPTLAPSFSDAFNLHKQCMFPQKCL